MNTVIVLALLHCFSLLQSAPTSGPVPTFRDVVEQTRMVVEKILEELPSVHAATVTIEGLTLDSQSRTANLQMVVMSLAIPSSPVIKPLSERYTLDMCVTRMLEGSQLYQGLVEVLMDKLSGLSDLKADLRDLVLRINKMKEVGQISVAEASDQNSGSDLASLLPGNYEVQVAVHQTLTQLRAFCQDMKRSLRNIANHRPQAAGSR